MAEPLTVVVVGLAIFVVAAFACQSAATNNVLRHAREARSAASGLYMSFYYVGGAAGAVVPGFVWSHFGWTATATLFIAVFAASAAVAYRRWRDSG